MNNDNKTIDRIISLVFTTSRLVHEKLKREKDGINPFSLLHLETLRYVEEKGNPLMKEVADYLCITPPSATSLVGPLVRSNALVRILDKDDRRAVQLSITPKGKKVLKEGFDDVNRRMQKILTKLDQKDQKNLIGILEKLSSVYN